MREGHQGRQEIGVDDVGAGSIYKSGVGTYPADLDSTSSWAVGNLWAMPL